MKLLAKASLKLVKLGSSLPLVQVYLCDLSDRCCLGMFDSRTSTSMATWLLQCLLKVRLGDNRFLRGFIRDSDIRGRGAEGVREGGCLMITPSGRCTRERQSECYTEELDLVIDYWPESSEEGSVVILYFLDPNAVRVFLL